MDHSCVFAYCRPTSKVKGFSCIESQVEFSVRMETSSSMDRRKKSLHTGYGLKVDFVTFFKDHGMIL